MELITIGAIVGYLANKIKENKAFKDFTADFTEASVNWIRPIFLKEDGTYKDVLKNLELDPDSEAMKEAAEAVIAIELKNNPTATRWIQEMYSVVKSKQLQQQSNISDSKNVNTGAISAGGNVSIGDSKS